MGSNDIDARMAALLKDHQAMGARPKVEPTGDTHEPSYPLKEKAALPASMTTNRKKVGKRR